MFIFEHNYIVLKVLRALLAFTSNKIGMVVGNGIELEYNNHISTDCH